MLLFAASSLVNSNEIYNGLTNYDGKERFKSTKWKKAADACKLLIDKAYAFRHGLYYEYINRKIDPFMSCYNVHLKKTSEGYNESPDCNYGDWEGHCTPRGCGGNGGYGVTQSLVDAFFMKNGLSPIQGYKADGSPIINETSGYKEKRLLHRTGDTRNSLGSVP